jgi:hypothetical protein
MGQAFAATAAAAAAACVHTQLLYRGSVRVCQGRGHARESCHLPHALHRHRGKPPWNALGPAPVLPGCPCKAKVHKSPGNVARHRLPGGKAVVTVPVHCAAAGAAWGWAQQGRPASRKPPPTGHAVLHNHQLPLMNAHFILCGVTRKVCKHAPKAPRNGGGGLRWGEPAPAPSAAAAAAAAAGSVRALLLGLLGMAGASGRGGGGYGCCSQGGNAARGGG